MKKEIKEILRLKKFTVIVIGFLSVLSIILLLLGLVNGLTIFNFSIEITEYILLIKYILLISTIIYLLFLFLILRKRYRRGCLKKTLLSITYTNKFINILDTLELDFDLKGIGCTVEKDKIFLTFSLKKESSKNHKILKSFSDDIFREVSYNYRRFVFSPIRREENAYIIEGTFE